MSAFEEWMVNSHSDLHADVAEVPIAAVGL